MAADIVVIASDCRAVRFTYKAAKEICKRAEVRSRLLHFFELRRHPPQEQSCRDVLNSLSDGVAIFFCHGDPDRIYGGESRGGELRDLISYPESHKVLKGLSIVAVCCSSAQILGKKVVAEEIAKVYFGFNEEISWEGINEATFKTYLAKVLKETLGTAFSEKHSFDHFRKQLELNLLSQMKHHFQSVNLTRSLERVNSIISAMYLGGDPSQTF